MGDEKRSIYCDTIKAEEPLIKRYLILLLPLLSNVDSRENLKRPDFNHFQLFPFFAWKQHFLLNVIFLFLHGPKKVL